MALFITSQRGGEKLVYNGYSYSKHRTKDDKTFWRCEGFQKPKFCRGRAESVGGNVIEKQAHNHEPSPQKCEAAEISARIKEAAATSTETAREVVTACLTGEIVKIPKITSLQRGVKRLRNKHQDQGPLPRNLAEIRLPDLNTLTARPENFIMGDSGPDDPERIIVLASRTDFGRLCSCSTWLADGTFKSYKLIDTKRITSALHVPTTLSTTRGENAIKQELVSASVVTLT
ncbi:hypothetical protein QR680_012730 [Steinernema hermaphroditum]|uniref:FLYWCH-type domain-containing protein n=1 Tax=Steinernema hermaphroditum TaxID=289476 RepID=A0AA39I2Y5_9BILA|nr:hypothetical protein QR680_012730 [Steinernema hermaphroditum]